MLHTQQLTIMPNKSSKNICLLGATGSIGDSTLDLIAQNPQMQLVACSAWFNVDKAIKIGQQFKPSYLVMADAEKAALVASHLPNTQVLYGQQALNDIATLSEVDTVVASIVGSAGLASTFAASKAGKKILLANKEVLVAAGHLFKQSMHPQTIVLPVDSEHNAIFQCYEQNKFVNKIYLTASGGPFLHTPFNAMHTITPEQACKHPKWQMGRKISVDSATMMNKGLELIEAFYLFDGLQIEQIDVLIHPQSIIHSMVEYIDGSVLAQLSMPDMRVPIAYCLAYPERMPYQAKPIDWFNTNLNFLAVDEQKFACLTLAKQALKAKQTTILNAANEVAVEAFLNQQLKFLDIANLIDATLNQYQATPNCLEEVYFIDTQARLLAKQLLKQFGMH